MNTGESATLTVLESGPLCTIQDAGRLGKASLGIGRSGAADRASYRLANRLLGNEPGSAALEVTFGGLVLRAESHVTIALTGARCPGLSHNAVVQLAPGATVRLAAPVSGLRTYVGVRGGVAAPEVLGSRSNDILAALGPEPLVAGDLLAVGAPPTEFPVVDLAPTREPCPGEVRVRVSSGPRRDWLTETAWSRLLEEAYVVTSESNRVGIRLDGPTLEWAGTEELSSEGLGRGALQVPSSGKPVLFLADHPVTGGYPVIGYVADDDVDVCAQLRPGQSVRFRCDPGAS